MKSKSTSSSITKRIDYKINKTEGVLNFDFDNIYPNRVEDIISDSGTATTCKRIKRKFLIGGGFKDKSFYKLEVNREGLTNDKLLRMISEDVTDFQSVGLHFNFNSLGEIVEINFIPVSNIRFPDPEKKQLEGKLLVYDDWNKIKRKTIKIEDIQVIDAFTNTAEEVIRQAEELNQYDKNGELIVSGWEIYKGQVLYLTPINGEYPLAFCDSVLEDMIVEGKMKRFKFSSITNNFLASHLLVTGAKEEGTDESDFIENLVDFQGSDDAGKILWLQKESADDPLELHKVDIQNFDGLYKYTEESVRDNIIRQYQIPPVLLLSIAGSLGANNQLKEAFSYYNSITSDERLIIEEVFEIIFSRWHVQDVNPTNDFSIIPLTSPKITSQISQEYFPFYTKNEIRVANGDSEVQDINANDKTLVETLGVGGLQGLTAVLVDQVLTYQQKLGTLKVVFGLDENQAVSILGQNTTIKIQE
jgi:hypothetical protein